MNNKNDDKIKVLKNGKVVLLIDLITDDNGKVIPVITKPK